MSEALEFEPNRYTDIPATVEQAALKGIGSLAVVAENGTENLATYNNLRLRADVIRSRVKRHAATERQTTDPVALYLNGIGQYPLLNADEERELSQQIEEGRLAELAINEEANQDKELLTRISQAQQAKERFINTNLRLVVSIAKHYPQVPGLELLDLIQEGNLGLEHAVDKFDWRKGFKFSTYASYWIRQAIGRAIDNKADLIRLKSDTSGKVRAAMKAVDGDVDKLDPQIAAMHALVNPISLDYSINEEDGSNMHDFIESQDHGTEEQALVNVETAQLYGWLDAVSDSRLKTALIERYGLEDGRAKPYKEIGEIIGMTTEGARRLVKRAETLLRNIADGN